MQKNNKCFYRKLHWAKNKFIQMRKIVLLLFVTLATLTVAGQDFYTVQVRSLSSETPLTIEELEMGMWQHKVDGLTKCFMGRFDTYEEAKAAMEPIKLSKYSAAFVVSSDKIFNTSKTVSNTSPAVVQLAEPDTTPVSKNTNDEEIYTIQIAAYRYPLYTKEFNLTDDVMEFYCSDNIYRYSVGKYVNEAEARTKLKQIKESGYPDAFLIDYSKYEVYRIE